MATPTCKTCGADIPIARVEAILSATGQLPDTCRWHSEAKPYAAMMVYGHKTGGEVQVVDPRNKEGLRQAMRAFRRSR